MAYVPTKLVTGPSLEPVTLDLLKSHCRIDHDDEDEWLKMQLVNARLLVENYTRRRLIQQTWDMWLDEWPHYTNTWPYPEINGTIPIPYPPLSSVTHVKYYDAAGTLTTLAVGTDYTVDSDSEPGRVVPYYGTSWPTVRKIPNTINIRFVCGYGTARSDVPEPLALALMQLVAYYHRDREPVPQKAMGGELPMHCRDLMARYTVDTAVGAPL